MIHQQEHDGDLAGSHGRSQARRKAMPRLTPRIDFDAGRAVGPGKIKLMPCTLERCRRQSPRRQRRQALSNRGGLR
jgi:hypothetical protein